MDSNTLIEVLSSLKSSGSGTGISYYSTRCARKARLDKMYEGESSFNARVGVVFHKLMELYYAGTLVDVALPLDDMADYEHDPVQEALRIFAGYTVHHPVDEWEVLHVEMGLPRLAGQGNQLLEDRLALLRIFSVPFTARIDMVVNIDAQHIDDFQKRRRLELPGPGVYLIDHKTTDKRDFNAIVKYDLNLQGVAYPLAFEAVTDIKPIGTIFSQVVRHKKLVKDSFNSFYVAYPNQDRIEAVTSHIWRKHKYFQTDECNLDACVDWGVCSHYMNGNCNRI
jgi:hypothetical protein